MRSMPGRNVFDRDLHEVDSEVLWDVDQYRIQCAYVTRVRLDQDEANRHPRTQNTHVGGLGQRAEVP